MDNLMESGLIFAIMANELTGKIVQVMDKQTGQGKNGPWQKQEYIIEIPGQYPKKVCFNAWGEKVDQFGIKQGENLTISFDVESREYNGRWYTDIRAWKVSRDGASDNREPGYGDAPETSFNQDMPAGNGGDSGATDDLPF